MLKLLHLFLSSFHNIALSNKVFFVKHLTFFFSLKFSINYCYVDISTTLFAAAQIIVIFSVYPDVLAPMSSMNLWPSSKKKDAVRSSQLVTIPSLQFLIIIFIKKTTQFSASLSSVKWKEKAFSEKLLLCNYFQQFCTKLLMYTVMHRVLGKYVLANCIYSQP